MQSGDKRKRDLDCPRITFQAPGRTFDRLFREDSLEQLQEVVRKKLGLQSDALVKLTQIRGTTDVDLEDDDDFDAFYNAVHSAFSASIRITVLGNGVVKNAATDKSVAEPPRKKRKLTVSQTPASGATEATPVTTPGLSSKRAASPVTSSEDASEPPSKRVRIPSPQPPAKLLEKHTAQVHDFANRGSAPTNEKPVPGTRTNISPGLTSPPAPNPPAPVEKLGTDAKKPTKLKAKKRLDASLSSLGVKTRDEVLEEQAKAEQELKKKEKSLKKERKKAGDDNTNLVSTKDGDGPKGTSSKGKKTKTSEVEKMVMPDSGKRKKMAKSKAQVQEAASDSVDSETNDVFHVNAQPKDALTNISLSIIEKYLTPQVSAIEVGSKDSASIVQSTPKVPSCPYCGKSLTHDRSHCPLLRTKLVHTIEQRLEELKANGNEDPEVRSNAISALEAALQRRRPPTTNKETVSCPSKPHPKSAPSVKISTSTPLIKPTSRPRSPTSSESSSEDDSVDEADPPRNDRNFRISVQPGPSGDPSASTSRLLTPQFFQDDMNTGDSSEHDTPSPGAGIKPKSIPFRPSEDDDSESSSSDNESEDVAASHNQGFSKLQLTRPTTLPSMNGGNGYNDQDLKSLIRGPGAPLKSTDLPSSDSSEDEESENVRLDNDSEQESNSQSRKFAPWFAVDSDSSDDDVEEHDENEREPSRNPSFYPVPPLVATSNAVSCSTDDPITEASQEKASFQQVNRKTGSEMMDRSGSNDFEDVRTLQNASLGLLRKELTPMAQKPSDPPATLDLHPRPHDQLEEEEQPVEESTLQTNGTTPDVMQQDPEREQPSAPPDLVGSIDASDVVPGTEPQSTAEAVKDNEGPSSPPPHTQEKEPREEPARASTPKPAMIQRMRGRTVGVPSPQKQAAPLSLNQAAAAKPSTRKVTFRAQSKSTNKNQSIEPHQNEVDTDAEPVTPKVKVAPKRGAANTTKTPLTRTKITVEKKSNGVEDKEPDPPPRRSQRMSSKPPSVAPEVLHANLQPLTRKTRSTSTMSNNKEVVESHSSKNSTKVVQKSKKVASNVTVNPSLPLPESKDSDAFVPDSQSGGPKALCPPSPPVSLGAWETLRPETPVGTTQSDGMIDELHSDMDPIPFPLKPQHRRKTSSFGRKEPFLRLEQVSQDAQDRMEEGEKNKEKPLFIPSESQTVFPHSQFQTDSQEHADGESSDSEEEVLATVANKVPRSQSQPSKYRRLSDIASQAVKMFTPKVLRQPPSSLQNSTKRPNTRKDRLDHFYGKMGRKDSDDIESDDDSGHDSDSNTSKTSHIPKSRKAGAASKGRMSVA